MKKRKKGGKENNQKREARKSVLSEGGVDEGVENKRKQKRKQEHESQKTKEPPTTPSKNKTQTHQKITQGTKACVLGRVCYQKYSLVTAYLLYETPKSRVAENGSAVSGKPSSPEHVPQES